MWFIETSNSKTYSSGKYKLKIKLIDSLPISEANQEQIKIKLIDFGFATYYNSMTRIDTRCGSKGYAAPEVFLWVGYDPSVDTFSCGVVMHALYLTSITLE